MSANIKFPKLAQPDKSLVDVVSAWLTQTAGASPAPVDTARALFVTIARKLSIVGTSGVAFTFDAMTLPEGIARCLTILVPDAARIQDTCAQAWNEVRQSTSWFLSPANKSQPQPPRAAPATPSQALFSSPGRGISVTSPPSSLSEQVAVAAMEQLAQNAVSSQQNF